MPRRHAPYRLVAGACLILMTACGQADGQGRPPVLKALEDEGLTIVQEFPAGKELRGFAAVAGDHPLAIYVTPKGDAIVGTRLDASGERVDDARLQDLVAKPMGERAWAQLESATWVRDGKANAPRVVYTFSDPNCPFCNRFWHAARPWVDAGKVQLRHVLVGIIKEDSPAKVAAILGAADRSAALLTNERMYEQGGIAPAKTVPAEVRKVLEENQMLMLTMGFGGTPGIVVRDEHGGVKKYNGMPQRDALAEVLGPL